MKSRKTTAMLALIAASSGMPMPGFDLGLCRSCAGVLDARGNCPRCKLNPKDTGALRATTVPAPTREQLRAAKERGRLAGQKGRKR